VLVRKLISHWHFRRKRFFAAVSKNSTCFRLRLIVYPNRIFYSKKKKPPGDKLRGSKASSRYREEVLLTENMSFAANQFVSRGYPNHACKNMDRYRKSFMNLRHRKNELGINNIAKYRDFHTVQKVARSSMQIQSISPNRIWAHTVPSMIFLCNSFEKKGSNLQCEAMQISSSDPSSSKTLGSSITMKQTRNSEKQFIERAIRLVKRVIQLCFTLFPVAALYPVHRFISSNRKNDEDSNSSDWYLKVCLRCVELSGAAVIKLMQVSPCG